MANENDISTWVFPKEGSPLDAGILDTSNGKFVGIIMLDHKDVEHRMALDPNDALKWAKAVCWVALEIQGKLPKEKEEAQGFKN
jgi:hypothetical protein